MPASTMPNSDAAQVPGCDPAVPFVRHDRDDAAPIQLAAQVIYLARFSPVGTLNAIREHQVSLVFAIPSMFGRWRG